MSAATVRTPFLAGQRLDLRPLIEADASGAYSHWFNDAEVCRGNSHHVFPYHSEAAVEYIQRVNRSRTDLVLAIIGRKNRRHIGNVALQNICWINRTAEFAIIIGDRTAWGKGLGTEAGRLLCGHGFQALNLNRIYCGSFEANTAMKKLALSLGMKEEGRRRQAAYKAGRYVDVIEYGVLRAEYEKLSE